MAVYLKVGRLSLGLFLAAGALWFLMRRSAVGALVFTTAILIVLYWGIR